MTTTTDLLCNYRNKKGSHCSSLSIISLSAGRRKEFPFLRHSCVQSVLSQLHVHPTQKPCFPTAQSIHFQETARLDPSSDKNTSLDGEDVKLKPSRETLPKVAMQLNHPYQPGETLSPKAQILPGASSIWLVVSCNTCEVRIKKVLPKENHFLKVEPKMCSDQHTPNCLILNMGQ